MSLISASVITNDTYMIIDYSDPNNRRELIGDLQPLLVGYVRKQLAPYFDDSMSLGTQASELGKVMRYLRDNLIIEFKN